jgi:hypothetical protein
MFQKPTEVNLYDFLEYNHEKKLRSVNKHGIKSCLRNYYTATISLCQALFYIFLEFFENRKELPSEKQVVLFYF